MGIIKAICISEKRGTPKKEVEEAQLLLQWGIAGDAHGGSWHRQISLLSYEKIQEFRERGADISYGAFGENLVVEGFDFRKLPLGTRFRCGEVLLEMTQIGKECHSHCEIYQRMGDCIMPREGVFAVVLSGGVIHKGDTIECIPDNLYQTIADRNKAERAVLATVLEGEHAGQKRLWLDDVVRWNNMTLLLSPEQEETIRNISESGILSFCNTRLFCEKIGSRKQLVICGGGHVSMPVIELGRKLGFSVTVIEDRPFFADNARRAGADRVLCDDFGHALSEIPGDTDTYFVIVTRGHRYDRECLEQILGKKHAYIGMMGSRRRGILLKKQLAEAGYKEALLEQVHTPIGLSIGAETPEEIAVSILAELIQVKNTERKISTYDPVLVTYLTGNSKDREAGVLCTIVSKRGSAPRECGTKMLLLQSGAVLGTIGGGCAESSIMEKGRMLLQGLLPSPRLEQVDMTAEQAEEEGMVCGGTILVYMELVSGFDQSGYRSFV